MQDFSQYGEQKAIEKYFRKQTGTFLDIGANDGVSFSNTHALALAGWSGVCVEPSPVAFSKLQSVYADNPSLTCIQAAISDKNGTADFFQSVTYNGNPNTLISTLIETETERWRETTEYETIKIELMSVEQLLSVSPYKQFDFISIDTEGHDLIILKQLNLAALGCRCICLEHNSGERTEMLEHCQKFGLTKTLLENGVNLILAQPLPFAEKISRVFT